MSDHDPSFRARRRWFVRGALAALAAAGAGCAWILNRQSDNEPINVPAPSAGRGPFTARVALDFSAATVPVNRSLLGANVQWVDRGDEMMLPNALQFRPAMVDGMKAMKPTVLRYPGGTLGDTYHWRDGIGGLAQRGSSAVFWTRASQKVQFGTGEFLELCRSLGAEPLITVNLITGTAEEAAAWVTATNVTRWTSLTDGQPLPKVRYWELGNEPYLKDDARPDLVISATEYTKRATEFARAMRAVDPSIRIGVPTRSDKIGGMPMTPFPGFGEQVLRNFGGDIDFVSVHDAYMPFAVDRTYSDTELYWAAMASAEVVAADLQATRNQLSRLRPGKTIPIAVTESNAMFTLTQDKAKTDAYIRSLTGAIYYADLLRMLSGQPDLLLSIYHSLSGNWHFGLVSNEGVVRPAYHVLANVSKLLVGNLVPVRIDTEAFATGRVGLVPPTTGLPLVTGLATRQGRSMQMMLINKDIARSARTTVVVPQLSRAETVRQLTLDAGDVFDTTDSSTGLRQTVTNPTAVGTELQLQLPAHSITFLQWIQP